MFFQFILVMRFLFSILFFLFFMYTVICKLVWVLATFVINLRLVGGNTYKRLSTRTFSYFLRLLSSGVSDFEIFVLIE